jgi:uncharacterized protein (TIGR00369 family)
MADHDDDKPPLYGLIGENQHLLLDHVPHAKAIGMKLVEVRRGRAIVSVPYDERFIGNPETGVIHGGVITTLLDNTMGIAVFCTMTDPNTTATLDMRIDYMRPAEPGREVLAAAHCYRMTRSIAFVRATAYHDDPEDPIATAAAAFMLGTANLKKMAKGFAEKMEAAREDKGEGA